MDQPPGGPPPGPPPPAVPPEPPAESRPTARPRAPDVVLLFGAAMFFVCTLLPWYRITVTAAGRSGTGTQNAWNAGSLAVLAAMLGTALLLVAFATLLDIKVLRDPRSQAALILALAVSTLFFTALRFGLSARPDLRDILPGVLVQVTRGIGLWLGLVFSIWTVVGAVRKRTMLRA